MQITKIDIGGEIISILTRGMYPDPKDAIREYIQNGIDAQSKEISVKVGQNTVVIQDDGSGMDQKTMRKAVRIGVSDKIPSKDVGFMGIGIYSSFHLCDNLTIYSNTNNLPNKLTIDFRGMREILKEEKLKRLHSKIESTEITDLQTLLAQHLDITNDGDLKYLILNEIYRDLLPNLISIDNAINWCTRKNKIISFIKTGRKKILNDIIVKSNSEDSVIQLLVNYKDYFRKNKYLENPIWDRICITTLFTFHWKITIDTIEFAKKLVKDKNELKIGGVLATVLSEEVYKSTGITPHIGLLNKPGDLDDNDVIIDELPLDYSILDEIDYKYTANNAYYGYMTRGCIRKCPFCAVWKIEPTFTPYISLKDKKEETKIQFGDKRNLLLLDNNVLASKSFYDIIEEIKDCGFVKGAKYIEPNILDIIISKLKSGYNDRAYVRKSFYLFRNLLERVKNNTKIDLLALLNKNQLLDIDTITKENILLVYPELKDLYDKYRNKRSKLRYVDFNQGIDARLINEKNMKLLSEIPINPLRIAFDNMKYKKVYTKAVHLAAKYEINKLSNYLLYNESDKPIELYQRIELNIELAEELDIYIYSFPMKYHPINGEEWYRNRKYIGLFWNKKFLRAIRAILNSTKGKVGRSRDFFYQAFGSNQDEYLKILYLPESYIIYRSFFKDKGYTDKWWEEINNFSKADKDILREIIHSNQFNNISKYTTNPSILQFINKHYVDSVGNIKNPGWKYYDEKIEYDEMKSTKLSLQPQNRVKSAKRPLALGKRNDSKQHFQYPMTSGAFLKSNV